MTSPDFSNINFQGFQAMAVDESLSKYERIGFPNSYREGFEHAIFTDICNKLDNLNKPRQHVLDIGPGCSDIPEMLIQLCRDQGHRLELIDNAEMLALLPDDTFINKTPALYPHCDSIINSLSGKLDVIICYSVLHYILIDAPFFRFLDSALSMLAPSGQFLIGDIPNVSKRKRFFSSNTGVRFHQKFMKTRDLPEVYFNQIEHGQIDDAIIFSLVQRARSQGFDAYIIPQSPDLPMANRREDILVVRP